MAAAGRAGQQPDLYQLLGVPREASREQITHAWRRRARAEHPDSRPFDAAATDRFRLLAYAYEVLSDPGRRAAYDRSLGYRPPQPGVAASPEIPAQPPQVQVTRPRPAQPGARPGARMPGPPLWAGPVRVEGPGRAPAPDGWDDDELTLAELLVRYLTRDWRRPP